MIFLGIDPGKTGAIAAITARGAVLDLCDMPLAAGEINAAGLYEILAQRARAVNLAAVEKTQAMPAIPRSTAHSLGMSEGLALGILTALAMPIRSVRPAVWKRAMNVPADKDEARAAALRLFPGEAPRLARKKDDGRAEALLLAEYARRIWMGEHGA